MTLKDGTAGNTGPFLITAACVAAAVAIAVNRGFYERSAHDIFLSILMASAAIVFVHIRPWQELWQLGVGFAALVAGQAFALRVPIRAGPAAALLGIVTFALLASRRIWSVLPEEKEQLRLAVLPPVLLVLLGYFSSGLLAATGRLHPKTLDLYLYAFDGSLGIQPSFAAGWLVLRSVWLTRMCLFWYYALPAALLLVYAQQVVRRGDAALSVFLAFFLAGPVGIIFYNLLPACGPIYLFPAQFRLGPMGAPTVRGILLQPIALAGARNAFPSLHVAWALLAWWYGKGLSPWTRVLVGMFLAGTILATLGLGEHYFIDLVAAIPFALMIWAATAGGILLRDRRRFLIFLAAVLWMIAWVGMLRFGAGIMKMSPLIPWTLVVGCILSCIVWQARLPVRGVGARSARSP